jgi:hypothetical protein
MQLSYGSTKQESEYRSQESEDSTKQEPEYRSQVRRAF